MPNPPRPRRLVELAGNPGKRRLREEPRGKPFSGRRPPGLEGDAAVAWERVVAALKGLGVLQAQDALVLELLARRWGEYRGGDHAAGVEVRHLLRELGLSPSARVRLDVAPPEEADPLEAFLRARHGAA